MKTPRLRQPRTKNLSPQEWETWNNKRGFEAFWWRYKADLGLYERKPTRTLRIDRTINESIEFKAPIDAPEAVLVDLGCVAIHKGPPQRDWCGSRISIIDEDGNSGDEVSSWG